ncbi:hypothetical protein LguiB_034724 [Lonicera macranthoides]
MRRLNGGETRGVDNTFETINAAATAIASAENRVPQASVQKRRWGSCWSIYWCFGSHKQSKRIGSAALYPETTATRTEAPLAVENPIQISSIVLPFVAPPSSPASFLHSETPSATHSPPATSISVANKYSPGGPASIFAIGPYAHETQLVSPPVFSTFTTEPSTAPFTPPPESVHLTTPSSPEVPFARLLNPGPTHQDGEASLRFPFSQYEFQTYQLHPGSPVGHLISPSSGISGSGTSSPFPDHNHPLFLELRTGDPPKFLNFDKLSPRGSGSLTPEPAQPRTRDGFILEHVAPLPNSLNGWRSDEAGIDHRVSFEITAEHVVRCVEKKPAVLAKAVSASVAEGDENSCECRDGETSNGTPGRASTDGEVGQRHQKCRSITLGSVKEFKFDSSEGGGIDKPNLGPDWWANRKVIGKEGPASKNWSFFPMMQPGVR